MFIIGIVANALHAKKIKKEIEEILKSEVVVITDKSIENIRNIKFEVIIMHNFPESLKGNISQLKTTIQKAKYLLLNADIDFKGELFEKSNTKILTYGLKQKSTLTVSGIDEKSAVVSIQRNFINIFCYIVYSIRIYFSILLEFSFKENT